MAAITVPDLPKIKHQSDFFRSGFLSLAMIGKSGCGKTFLLTHLIPVLSKDIKTLLIATFIKDVPVHKAIVEWWNKRNPANKKGKPEYWAGITHDPMEARGVIESFQKFGMVSPERPALILFDDFSDGRCTPGSPYVQFIIHAFTKLRNDGFHFIILTQQPQMLPTVVRQCTTARILFDCASKTAIDTFAKDVLDRVPSLPAFRDLTDYIRRVPYSYILCREWPFEVSVGKGLNTKSCMTENSVSIPTIRQLMTEMGATSRADLDRKSREAQKEAGNTAEELDEES